MNRKTSAFSLLEVIAVLGLLSILVGVVVPPMIERIDHQVRKAEANRLKEMSRGLKGYIRGELEMPDGSSWKNDLADQMGLSPDDVAENGRGYARRFLVHPDFQGKLTAGQNASGVTNGLGSAKMVVLSSVYRTLPEADELVQNASHFTDIWETSADKIPDRLANDLGWGGSAEDLMMEKINLRSMFQEVIFHNVQETGATGYRIDGSQTTLSEGLKVSGYYLKGTVIGFEDAAGNLVAEEIVQESQSYFYKDEAWHTSFPGDPETEQWVLNYMAQLRDWFEANGYDGDDITDGGDFEAGGPKFHLIGPK